MGETRTTRWRRFGHDRLYVQRADGTRLGYWDLFLDQPHAHQPAYADELATAAREWRGAGVAAEPQAPDAGAGAAADRSIDPPAPTPAPAPAATRAATRATDRARATDPAGLAHGVRPAPHPRRRRRPAAGPGRSRGRPVRTALARVLRVHTSERAWRIGADGEEKVAAQLAELARRDPAWGFLHAVPVGDRGSDIDHVVVGPGGVFTLNAKNHPGKRVWVGGSTVMVGGQRVPYVRNSRHEAKRAARLLSAAVGTEVPVQGVVVLVGATDVTIKTQPDDVAVVTRRRLRRWLADRPVVLTPPQVVAAFEAARRSATWQPHR